MSKPSPASGPANRLAEVLQRASGSAIRLGRNGVLLVIPLLLGYVLLGSVLMWIGVLTLPYPFLSVTADPVFNLFGFVAGISIVVGSGGLLVRLMMEDLQGVGNQLAIVLLGISIGSSAAILRHTYETALSALWFGLRLVLEFVGVG